MDKIKKMKYIDKKTSTVLLNDKLPFAYKEAYKKLKLNLDFSFHGSGNKVLMVTSTKPGEGKTTTAINLAASIAQAGNKVILLECDLRKGNLATIFNKAGENTSGLSELLIGKQEKEKNIYIHPVYGFHYILAGVKPPNPVELLGSNKMKNILEKLKQRYDYIICDTAPVLELADATAFAKYCDGVLLVVRQNYALKEEVVRAKNGLVSVGANIMGTVITRYNLKDDLKRTQRRLKGYGDYYDYYVRDDEIL